MPPMPMPDDETGDDSMPPQTPPPMGGDDQEPPEMGDNQVCVALDSLSMPDEQDQMTPPTVGEKVQLNIEGTVDRIEGDKAYVTMSAVNGNEVEPDEDDEAAEENGIRQDIGNLPPGY